MPHAPALATCDRGGRIAPRRLALRGRSGDPAEAPWSRSAELAGFELELAVETDAGAARIAVEVRNPGPEPRALGSVLLTFDWLAYAPGALRALTLGAAPDQPCVVSLLEPGAQPPTSQSAVLVGALAGAGCALVGAHETGVGLARAWAHPREGGARIEVELAVEDALAPGEHRRLDAVEVSVGDDPAALLEAFAARWGRAVGARAWRPAPLVWTAPDEAGAEGVLRALDALTARGDALPFEVLCLARGRPAALGDWTRAGPGYPDGFGPVIEAIRAAGLVPGLWTAPLFAAEQSATARAHPDWLVRVPGAPAPVLDAAREAVGAHLRETFAELHALGFFYLELDGLSATLGAGAGSAPAVRRLRRGLEAVRAGAGEESFLLAREVPLGAAVGVVDALAMPGSEPAREARRRAWMHRRLALCAAAAPGAADLGATLLAEAGAPGPAEVARWRRAARESIAVDRRGVPGVARVTRLLEEEPSIAPDALAEPPLLAVFCDFDGTFSVQDVGATLALRHGGARRPRVWARTERGEITPWDYNLAILDGLPVGAEALDSFLAGVDLDPGAPALLDWCAEARVPFRVLSDGFDWNLNRLQWRHGVRFAYTANHLRVEHGRWRIAAGAPDPNCGCGTGTCKAAALRATRALHPKAHLVHIGNGRVSDSCGAIEADTAFAKDSLAESLARRGEPFVPFETLRDVIPHLERILAALHST